MAIKKNFALPERIQEYLPPRLVKAKQGWYIIFYHQLAGAWIRERRTFNLNRIRDSRRRLERAREIMQRIDASLAQKSADPGADALAKTPILEAIGVAADRLCQSNREQTRKSFHMIHKMLRAYIAEKGWGNMAIGDFSKRHARAFMDAALAKGIRNSTYNNYRGFCITLFNVLRKDEYISTNPFEAVTMRRREEKLRRAFTPNERAIVLQAIYERDYWLFVLVMLHRFTLLRRTECYRLRFNNFNLAEGYIHLPASITKNGRAGTPTIPDALRDFLADRRFSGQPGNYLLFGKGGAPHPAVPAGENTYKRRHREILLQLRRSGALSDISGLSLYSWKDTGMTEFARVLRPIELRDQARHASIDQSLAYYHADKVSQAVKKVDIPLID